MLYSEELNEARYEIITAERGHELFEILEEENRLKRGSVGYCYDSEIGIFWGAGFLNSKEMRLQGNPKARG